MSYYPPSSGFSHSHNPSLSYAPQGNPQPPCYSPVGGPVGCWNSGGVSYPPQGQTGYPQPPRGQPSFSQQRQMSYPSPDSLPPAFSASGGTPNAYISGAGAPPAYLSNTGNPNAFVNCSTPPNGYPQGPVNTFTPMASQGYPSNPGTPSVYPSGLPGY